MACTNNFVLEGFSFTFDGRTFDAINNTTTFCYIVKGNGISPSDLSNWVIEVDCPVDDFTIVGCTRQELPNGQEGQATCEKVTNPPASQVQLIGVKFDEPVGKEVDDPAVRFCVTFQGELFEGCVNVGYKAGTPTFKTMTKPLIGPTCQSAPNFCCTIPLPNYLNLVTDTAPKISFNPNCLSCSVEGQGMNKKAIISGCIPIYAAVQVENMCGIRSWLCCSEVLCDITLECASKDCAQIDLCNVIGILDENAIQFDSPDSPECPGKKLVKITGNVTLTCPT
jgi:hypothetical protein